MLRACVLTFAVCLVMGQTAEEVRIERHGDRALLVSNSYRPVHDAAIELAKNYGVRINVEDPSYTAPDREHSWKGGQLTVWFDAGTGGAPADFPKLLRDLASLAESQYPAGWRVLTDGDSYTLAPAKALLDLHVTIPGGERLIRESGELLAESLAAQTGKRIACCQSFVSGIPWGNRKAFYSAIDKPAREVLAELINLASDQKPIRTFWVERCDPAAPGWCMIDVMYAGRVDTR